MIQRKLRGLTLSLLVISLIVFPQAAIADAYNDSYSAIGYNYESYSEGNTIINHIVYVLPSSNNGSTKVSQKTISHGWEVNIDGIHSYTLRHDITYSYGLNVNGTEKAQIISYKSYVSYINPSSAYYPDTSTLSNTLTKIGNPAKLKTVLSDYSKTTNKKHGTITAISKCYGSGSYSF